MASAPNGGHDCTFVDELPENFICAICSLAFKDPIQFEHCGHRLCKSCFNQLKEHASTRNVEILCPYDRGVIDPKEVFNDKGIYREILDLKVYCDGQSRGCTWVDELRALKTHEKSCSIYHSQFPGNELNGVLLKLENLQMSMAKKNEEIDEYKEDLKRCQNNVIELQLKNQSLEDIIEQLQKSHKESLKSNEFLQSVIQEVMKNNKKSEEIIQQLSQKNLELENNIQEITGKFKASENTMKGLTQSNKALENGIEQLKQNLETVLDKKSLNPYIYEWVVNYNELKKSFQESEKFYLVSLPYCFQLKSYIGDGYLKIGVYRCRGKHDKPVGQIKSEFSQFKFEICLVSSDGCVTSKTFSFTKEKVELNIEKGSERSETNYGFPFFYESAKLEDWIIYNNLHFYFKFERK